MRDNLVGYLLGALEPEEQASLESRLAHDPAMQQDLEALRRALHILDCDRQHHDPPPGLAHRTCQYVSEQVDVMLTPAAPPARRWRVADFAVAALVFLAASVLFFPALSKNRYAAQLTGCKNNLMQLGRALTQYSDLHGGNFPELQPQGRQAVAGVYAIKLIQQGHIKDHAWIICPASPQADHLDRFRVPTFDELEKASRQQLVELHRSMGGSYGYNLGYVSQGEYKPTRNLHRVTFAIMADAPATSGDSRLSMNHGGSGQNVLFEDEHIEFLTKCNAALDDIFLNEAGEAAAGSHRDDAVIGSSHVSPLPILSDDRER